ncbi:hypothetical protein [Paracoccus seriniphilus]|uniref:Uncharacterized protein n=1 Tax=Paracoccus seriniphilus TaxID=184748 RepID=A0A239Q3C6_9RHOB|nr:hypothetical protein [Paracoccus seriniphilus]SNT76447.1 hypothetical protein SAMN05444959_12014 [Paracoccus seriniphilus]
MLIVPAIIVAIACGSAAFGMALVTGFGLKAALIGYWLAGNLGMLATLLPRLFMASTDREPVFQLRDRIGFAVAGACIILGLVMIFWQTFHAPMLWAAELQSYEIGKVLGLNEAHVDNHVYALSLGFPSALSRLVDHALRLELWVAGLLIYTLGLTQIGLVAMNRFAPAKESAPNSKAF